MADWRDNQHRYLVHFSDGGAGMRYYGAPLDEGAELVDCGERYHVVRVERPPGVGGFGHAWAEGQGRKSDYRPPGRIA